MGWSSGPLSKAGFPRPVVASTCRIRVSRDPTVIAYRGWASGAVSGYTPSDDGEFYRYNGGRWLWDEENQLKARYKKFNIPQLKKLATSVTGASCCSSITKLAEGGFNKVFRMTMNDGSTVIARIPYSKSGLAVRAIASEVASMEFARSALNIPIPKVLAWSGNEHNPVESEYILMQEAKGQQLDEIWDELDLRKKLNVVQELVKLEKSLLSAQFKLYGSLYFASDAFPGCEKAEISGDVSDRTKAEVERRFVIGPVVDKSFWDGERANMNVDCGPWKRAQDYLKAVAKREMALLKQSSDLKTPADSFRTSGAPVSVDTHTALYEKYLAVADHLLPDDTQYLRPTLWHWDLHAPNVFVSGDRITSVIDWQDVWAGPLFLQVGHPRLVDYDREVMLKLPEHYETLEDAEEKLRVRTQVEKSIVLWAYESDTRKQNPLLDKILHIPHGRTRRDAVEFSADADSKNLIPFRQALIRVERFWKEIRPDIPCPIHFTDDELRAYTREGEGWNENADFWASLEGFVSRDGWTSHEDYDRALDMFAQLREQGLQDLKGQERIDFEKDTRWAVKN